jgi:hypothetical protein
MYNDATSGTDTTRTAATMAFRQYTVKTMHKVTRTLLRQQAVVYSLLIWKTSPKTWDYHQINSINYEKWLYKK